VSILFVTYLLFEVPSNLVLKLFTPRRWLAFIAAAWGIIATLTGLVNSYGSLLACRLLLGVVEAGLFPGLTVYLTFFYTKRELALRVGYLFVSAAVAGALGGLLAYGIGHMDGVRGMSGWRWIMIIEGIPSFLIGIVTYLALPNDAETAYFLDDGEKALMRLRHAREYGNTASSREFSKKDMMCAFKDWKVWAFCVAQFGVDTMLYGKFGHLTQLPRVILTDEQASLLFCRPSSEILVTGQSQRHSFSPCPATSSVPRHTCLRLSSRISCSAVDFSA
jgi:MFS family permease